MLLDNGPRNFSTAPLHERLEATLTAERQAGTRVVVIGSAVDGYFVSHGHIGNNLTAGTLSGDPRSFLRVQSKTTASGWAAVGHR